MKPSRSVNQGLVGQSQQNIQCTMNLEPSLIQQAAAPLPPPLLFTFVCDTSGSMVRKCDTVYQEICHFIEHVMKDDDMMELLTFNRTVTKQFGLLQKRRLDLTKVKEMLTAIGGTTALYDGIGQALSDMSSREASKHRSGAFQREMIVLTDGEENSSRTYKFDEIKEKIRNPGIDDFHLMIIGVGIDNNYKKILNELCKPMHAKYLDCSESREEIQKIFRAAVKEIKDRQSVTIQLNVNNTIPSSPVDQQPALDQRNWRDANNNNYSTHDAASSSKQVLPPPPPLKRCKHSFQCELGLSCRNQHTETELGLFRANGGIGIRGYKSKECTPDCRLLSSQCVLAHSRDDSICYSCDGVVGHLSTDRFCPLFGRIANPLTGGVNQTQQQSPTSFTSSSNGRNNKPFLFDFANYQPQQQQQHQIPRAIEKPKKRCRFSYQCNEGLRCSFQHTDHEISIFALNKGVGIHGYKSRECKPLCSKSPSECLFAHSRDDSICYKCGGVYGHLFTDRICPHFGSNP